MLCFLCWQARKRMQAMEEQMKNPAMQQQMAQMQAVMANPEMQQKMAALRVRRGAGLLGLACCAAEGYNPLVLDAHPRMLAKLKDAVSYYMLLSAHTNCAMLVADLVCSCGMPLPSVLLGTRIAWLHSSASCTGPPSSAVRAQRHLVPVSTKQPAMALPCSAELSNAIAMLS